MTGAEFQAWLKRRYRLHWHLPQQGWQSWQWIDSVFLYRLIPIRFALVGLIAIVLLTALLLYFLWTNNQQTLHQQQTEFNALALRIGQLQGDRAQQNQRQDLLQFQSQLIAAGFTIESWQVQGRNLTAVLQVAPDSLEQNEALLMTLPVQEIVLEPLYDTIRLRLQWRR